MSVQKQFGQLAGMVMQNMPELDPVHMQGWIGDPEGLQELLSGLKKGKHIKEKDGVVSFLLPMTDGTTGREWIERLRKGGHRVFEGCERLLMSPDFKPTTGVVYRVKVLKRKSFPEHGCTTKSVQEMATQLKLGKLNAEAACLMCENLTVNELMAFGYNYIVVMSGFIRDTRMCDSAQLTVRPHGSDLQLSAFYEERTGREWSADSAAAFAAFAFSDES